MSPECVDLGYFSAFPKLPGSSTESMKFISSIKEALEEKEVSLVCFTVPFNEGWTTTIEDFSTSFTPNTYTARNDSWYSVLEIDHFRPLTSSLKLLQADLMRLTSLVHTLSGEKPVYPELKIQSGDLIDDFQGVVHTDIPSLNLVCTLFGSGTEFTSRKNCISTTYHKIDRWPWYKKAYALGNKDDLDSLAPMQIGIFKGQRNIDDPRAFTRSTIEDNGNLLFNQGKGLIHRAPLLYPGEKRIFFQCYVNAIPDFLLHLSENPMSDSRAGDSRYNYRCNFD